MKINHVAGARRLALPLAAAAALTLGACGGGSSSEGSADTASDPSKFSINLDDCNDPASVTEPIKGTFDIGYSAPLSGPVAGAVELATAGYDARIAAENEKGGVDGVKIKVTYKDDAFQPDKAKANGTEFIDSLKVDALATFGTGPLSAMVDDQNAACVPMLYPSSSTADFVDVEQFPWTTTILPLASNEAKFLVSLIQQKYPDGVKVGVAENQTASGKVQSEAFQAAAKEADLPIEEVTSDADPVAAATTLKAKGVEVVYHGGVTGTCGAFDTARGRVGYEPELVLKPSNCVNAVEYIAAGQAADGVELGAFGKDPNAPEYKDDAGVKEYVAQMKAAGVTDEVAGNAVAVSGWTQADLIINTMKQAAESEDGLTRLSVMQAARDQDYDAPMLIDGINWYSTPELLTGIDGFRPITWNASEKRFTPAGDVISIRP
ncbi:ABC transporter substrate-binding protein [Aeromicrobium fastidiosum]|uniref:ABC transporter substrate-binding protein n=1 Tax=Aeromicrobium fastidiosum TaxID=52699 RepID=A0A641ARE6_9ACTN|nr:ABC transporter substrate-binding protein [Aeromicrobium fastidiosum]KAA1380087.1 ABC transporter substrate-binding protein [Aeromicrobium fastidiosum]MBP2389617.1 ABC-type branched-subunit amino acid transport system substrate-binding protein [Aeromicrobium fastidiosum]